MDKSNMNDLVENGLLQLCCTIILCTIMIPLLVVYYFFGFYLSLNIPSELEGDKCIESIQPFVLVCICSQIGLFIFFMCVGICSRLLLEKSSKTCEYLNKTILSVLNLVVFIIGIIFLTSEECGQLEDSQLKTFTIVMTVLAGVSSCLGLCSCFCGKSES
ncbi:hypothetical protein OAG24_00305 [bacterium]|nr:hypothetical protein [bacterium]